MNRDRATALLDALHAAQNALYAGGSDDPLWRLITADVVWTIPGASPIAGSDVLVGETRRLRALTDGTATLGGREHEWSTVGLYYVTHDDRIVSPAR